MTEARSWRMLVEADDVTDEIVALAEDLAESNYADRSGLPTEEFIDDLCRFYGGSGYDETDWDLDRYDNPAAKKIMKAARAAHREARS